jgi:hypothetical protein
VVGARSTQTKGFPCVSRAEVKCEGTGEVGQGCERVWAEMESSLRGSPVKPTPCPAKSNKKHNVGTKFARQDAWARGHDV